MRIAALYDIHGNLPALEAVLEEVRRSDVDLIVVGGDIVPGPMPRETIDCLLGSGLPVKYLRGNCEVAVLAHLSGAQTRALPREAQEAIAWTAEQLGPADRVFFEGWPKTLRLAVEGIGDVLFCHATPRDEDECFTRLTSEELLAPIFAGLDAAMVVCGHTHMQFDRVINGLRVVNAGSVGMPFGEPGADWLLLGPGVQLRHTPYDLANAAEQIRGTAYPQAEEFATRSVLQPPTEADMLKLFAGAESQLGRPQGDGINGD
jgi:predicted phosphodiesterase